MQRKGSQENLALARQIATNNYSFLLNVKDRLTFTWLISWNNICTFQNLSCREFEQVLIHSTAHHSIGLLFALRSTMLETGIWSHTERMNALSSSDSTLSIFQSQLRRHAKAKKTGKIIILAVAAAPV